MSERYNAVYAPDMIKTEWAAHYLIYKFFLEHAEDVPTLDLCCGTGAGTKMIHEALKSRVVGVDYSHEALEFAEEHNSGPSYEKFDLNDPNELGELYYLIEDCDVGQCFFVEGIEHVREPEIVLSTLFDAGVSETFVSTPIEPEGKGAEGFHVSPFTPSRVAELEKDFRVTLLGYQQPLTLPVTDEMAAAAITQTKPASSGNYLWRVQGR